MSIEKCGDSDKFLYCTEEETRYFLHLQKYRLDIDAVNVWQNVLGRYLDRIKPAEHYETYIRRKNAPPIADLIMQLSDPEAVVAFDRIVDDFNADLERIKRDNDFSALKQFVEMGAKIVYSKRK
jgi:hypothetical protein